MSEVERCPECGGLAGPDGVLSHGYVHVRHETGGGGMNRRCSQTPKPEEPTVVAGGGGYDPRALTALAKNLDKARDEALSTCTTVERHALLMRNNTARGDQGQMSTPVSEPARTITTTGHQSLLDAPAPTIDIQDVQFRMLEPAEIIAAMDFPDYYRVLGNRREKVRMADTDTSPVLCEGSAFIGPQALPDRIALSFTTHQDRLDWLTAHEFEHLDYVSFFKIGQP